MFSRQVSIQSYRRSSHLLSAASGTSTKYTIASILTMSSARQHAHAHAHRQCRDNCEISCSLCPTQLEPQDSDSRSTFDQTSNSVRETLPLLPEAVGTNKDLTAQIII